MGVMAEIKELLKEGKTSREIIDIGYAPGTTYRVQREFRRQKERQDVDLAEWLVNRFGSSDEIVPHGEGMVGAAVSMAQGMGALEDSLGIITGRLEAMEHRSEEARVRDEAIESLASRVAQLEERFSYFCDRIEAQLAGINAAVEEQALMGVHVARILYHLDTHHLEDTHGHTSFKTLPLRVSDDVHQNVRGRIRDALLEVTSGPNASRVLGLRSISLRPQADI